MTAETIDQLKQYLEKERWIFNLHFDDMRRFQPWYENDEARCIEIPFPTRAGKFAWLASSLPGFGSWAEPEWDGGTLAYTEWGVWDERGNLAGYQMIERIRSTFGENRPFHLAPVHRFRPDERHLLTSFLVAALVYGWDACYIPHHRGWFGYVSHDEWTCLVTERDEDFKRVAEPLLNEPELGFRLLATPCFGRRDAKDLR
jgi:hypothetical protein